MGCALNIGIMVKFLSLPFVLVMNACSQMNDRIHAFQCRPPVGCRPDGSDDHFLLQFGRPSNRAPDIVPVEFEHRHEMAADKSACASNKDNGSITIHELATS